MSNPKNQDYNTQINLPDTMKGFVLQGNERLNK